MAREDYNAVFGRLMYSTDAIRDTAETRIRSRLGTRRFRNATPTVKPIDTSKYGGPPFGLTVNVVFDGTTQGRTEADELYADATESVFWGQAQTGSMLSQITGWQDEVTGAGDVQILHQISKPAAPDDKP